MQVFDGERALVLEFGLGIALGRAQFIGDDGAEVAALDFLFIRHQITQSIST